SRFSEFGLLHFSLHDALPICTVVGEDCSHVAVQRSGYDTLQFTLGNATASTPIIVAAAPSVNPAVGDFAMADTIPGNPGNVWSQIRRAHVCTPVTIRPRMPSP